MEGWRQWRLGREKILPNKYDHRLDSDRPSHGRRLHSKPLLCVLKSCGLVWTDAHGSNSHGCLIRPSSGELARKLQKTIEVSGTIIKNNGPSSVINCNRGQAHVRLQSAPVQFSP